MASRGKEFPLSIVIKTVDRATSGLKRVNDQIDRSFKPLRDLNKAAGALYGNMGIPKITAGFRGIGSVLKSTALGFGVLAAGAGGAVLALKGVVDEYDQLGARAERLGVTVDALAQLQYGAEMSDVEVSELDSALLSFNKGLGQASAGVGRMSGFLKKVSPELLKQLKGAKNSEEALGLMADAMLKLKDPAKRTALAMAVFGGSGAALIPMLTKGSAGIDEMKAEFLRLAGSQKEAADVAGRVDAEMKKAGAAMKGVKAAILEGLGPAFEDLARSAAGFLAENREKIAAWGREFGEKLPERIREVVAAFKAFKAEAIDPVVRAIKWMVEQVGGAENAVKLLVGAWLTFKAIQMVGHLASIAQGLIGVATAARAAAGAMAGVSAAGGATGAVAAAGGVRGAVGSVVRAAPVLAATYVGASLAAGVVDRSQENRMSANDRGRMVRHDLKRFRDRGTAGSQNMLMQSLRHGGFVDPKTGKITDNLATRRALDDEEIFGSRSRKTELEQTIKDLNAILSRPRPTLGAGEVPTGRPGAPSAAVGGQVKLTFENVPKGTRVTTSRDTKGVDLEVGYQMGAP